jgi:uncharacterized protein
MIMELPKMKQKAIVWYLKSEEQGHAIAQFYFGLLFFHGFLVAKDEMKAFEWYLKSAEQGDANAQFNLGLVFHGFRVAKDVLMFENDDGVEKDETKVIKWFLKAA